MAENFRMDWTIDRSKAGMLIRDFLTNNDISRAALTDIKFKGGCILVNGEAVTVRYKLLEGDCLTIIFPSEIPGFQGEKIPFSILYEDDFLVVAVKPSGMNTIPSREHPSGSLANALVGYYQDKGILATAHIVTRLDRDTSGIVLIAKHRHAHHLFGLMQRKGQVKRTYEALAKGLIYPDYGTITAPIGRKDDSIIEREVREDGQFACTHYRVLTRYRDYSHIELQLETGRTHQIRVHMSYLGHPLLGDDLYGGDTSYLKRQALHCKKIKFIHPLTGEEMNFSSSLPADMEALVKAGP